VLSSLAIAGVAAHVGGPGFGFGWLFLLIPLFWILVIALVFGIAGRRWRNAGWAGHGHGYGPWAHGGWAASRGAESTLAERFAQGDIEEKEYRARLEVIRANRFPERPEKG
jgi:putative membrane protein